MKNIILLLSFLIPFLGSAQDKFEIAGTLSAVGTGCTILLRYKNSTGEDAADSIVTQNGKFIIRGLTSGGNMASLSLLTINRKRDWPKRQPDEQFFFLEKGNYTVRGKDSVSKASLTGSPSQKEFLAYKQQTSGPRAAYGPLVKKLDNAIAAKDSVAMAGIRQQLVSLFTKMNAIRDSFIFSHPDSYVTLNMVIHEVNPLLHPAYYQALSKRMLASLAGQKLSDRMKKSELIALGKTIDIIQPDDRGKPFILSSLRGKYVLVDFWASWCGPCRGETPFLIRAYNALKDRNFEIVSISLDADKAAWLKAVKEDKMSWIQLSDLKGTKNEVAERFGITSIPQNLLIGPNGTIIGKNLRGEDVTEQITTLIH